MLVAFVQLFDLFFVPNMPPKTDQLGLRSKDCSHVEKMNKLRRPKAGLFFGNDLETAC